MLRCPKTTDLPATSATVLVVDDTASARYLVTKTLDDLGFTTLIAADGAAALSSVRDYHPDAIVTDLEMPGMDGERLIEKLRSSAHGWIRGLPIIVCSSKTDAKTVGKLRQLGVDAVVPKPVDRRLLAEEALRLFNKT